MIPFTATAHLRQPAAANHPPMLDALLYVGLHRRLHSLDPARWPGPQPLEEVFTLPLPLAQVETAHGWWWAASQATPEGPEAVRHEHRRAPEDAYARFQRPDDRGRLAKVDIKAGPDKALRIPVYTRPGWWTPTWAGVAAAAPELVELLGLPADADPLAMVRLLLRAVPSIGARTNAGHGAIDRWEVVEGGPGLSAYRSDVTLRHLPVEVVEALPEGRQVVRKAVALRPPYYSRTGTTSCLQVRS